MHILRISHSAVVGAWRERERQLRALGLQVTLLSARRWNEGGTIVHLEPDAAEQVEGVRTFGSHPALFVYDPRPIWRAMGQQIDVIDIHEEPFALATAEIRLIRALRYLGARRRPPYLLYSAQNIFKRYPFPFSVLERSALRSAAAVSVCNQGAAEVLRRKGLRAATEVIGLGVDLERFVFTEANKSTSPKETIVGYAGRLADHKGVSVLLDAVAGTDQLSLWLAGDGPARASLEKKAKSLGDRVRFLGSLTQDELPAFYRRIDVLAVPSLSTKGWVEQFGRVAVEAMACGTPVIASDSGALPDVVGGAGMLVPPGDVHALRRVLLILDADPELREELSRRGLRRAQEYSWPAVARRYSAMYAHARSNPEPVSLAPDTPAVPPEVIVVAYGSVELLRAAITPLVDHYPITIVDNSSLSEIRGLAVELGARYFDPGSNGGFAAGVNIGLDHRTSTERDVLLLNPDAAISPEDITRLHRALHAEPGIASAGPSQVDDQGTPARVVWPFPSPARTWCEAFGLGALMPARKDRTFVIGSVLLVNAAALVDVGRLDERFFLYAEETDWSKRAVQRGWRHVHVAEAIALHLGGATSTDSGRRETHFHASQEKYLRKHFGSGGWQVGRTAALLGAAIRIALLRGSRRLAARERLKLYARSPIRAESALAPARR